MKHVTDSGLRAQPAVRNLPMQPQSLALQVGYAISDAAMIVTGNVKLR